MHWGALFQGGNKQTYGWDPETNLIITQLFGVGTAILSGWLLYFYSTKDQRIMDAARTQEVQGSDFDFNLIDCDEARKQMQEVAESYLYVENAEFIIDVIVGIIKTKQENPNAPTPVISLDGNAGSGKTSFIKRILAAIGIIPIIISPTDVDNGNKKISPLQQAYGTWTSRYGNYFMQVEAPLTRALKINQHYTCVLFDDADKFSPEVIQGFWNIADGGKIKSGDNYIDTTKLFTFVTSNRSINDLADSMLSEGKDAEWIKAIKTRFMCFTIPTPRLIDYQNKLRDLLEEFASLYEDIDILAKDETINSIAQLFFDNGKCMRNLNECRVYLNGALSRFRSEGITKVELKLFNNSFRLFEHKSENVDSNKNIDYKSKLRDLLKEFSSLYKDIKILVSDETIDSVAQFLVDNGKSMKDLDEYKIHLNDELSKLRSKGVKTIELKFIDNSVRLLEHKSENVDHNDKIIIPIENDNNLIDPVLA